MKTHFTYYSPLMTASMAAALAFLEPQARGEDAQPARPNTQVAAAEKSQPEAQKQLETAEKEYQKARALQARAADQRAEEALRAASGPKQEYDLVIADGMLIKKGAKEGKLEATLANVVDALRERHSSANIAIAPGVAKLKIGDVKLRAGLLWDELEAIRVASGSGFDWMAPGSLNPNFPGPGLFDPATGLPRSEPTDAGLFVLREPAATPENQRIVEAFNLSGYLNWLEERYRRKESKERWEKAEEVAVKECMDQIESIIDETSAMVKGTDLGAASAPRLKFHRGANLLVVVGTSSGVETVRKLVSALPGQPSARDQLFDFHHPGSPEANAAAQNEAFRRRYGLEPGGRGGAPSPAPQPGPKPFE